MARGDHQNDDDDFMDPPQRNRETGQRKDGDDVTVNTPPPPAYVLGCHLELAVVCYELQFHDSENMATNDHLSALQKKKHTRNRASQE